MTTVVSATNVDGSDATRRVIEPRQHSAARIAGFWYLFAMSVGMFADLYAHGQLVVAGDAAQTAKNIASSEWLFRIGTVSHLVVFAGDVVLLVALYRRPRAHQQKRRLACRVLAARRVLHSGGRSAERLCHLATA